MKTFKPFFTLPIIVLLLLLSSCSVNRVQYGNYEKLDCRSTVSDKGKEISLFWEQVPIRKMVIDPSVTDYEKVMTRGFFDTVIYYGTIGILSFRTVRVRVKECDEIETPTRRERGERRRPGDREGRERRDSERNENRDELQRME